MTRERAAAEIAQAITYEGAPCKLGHTLRYTSNGNCIRCALVRINADNATKRNKMYCHWPRRLA